MSFEPSFTVTHALSGSEPAERRSGTCGCLWGRACWSKRYGADWGRRTRHDNYQSVRRPAEIATGAVTSCDIEL